MTLTMRKLAPAALIAVLALAGCAAPKSGDKPAASNAGQPPQAQAQAQTPAPAPATSPTVEFYIATTTADPSLVAVPVADGTLYMQRTPVLTRADLSEAQALDDRSGQNYVGLRFNEAGARKLSDISTQNQGKILVLVIDRELVAAPRLTEPLTRGVLAFGVPSAQAAVAIAAKIRGDAAAAPKP
ncbi:SecDF P1 head subdomain-containing protein [Bordetella avium]|uniref:Exported protein n=1 Tax=Bordetella avium (strain 197N) TaxID=360910 RepID=Q2L078_BORA1|nr:preprotein translocase subunit SecD [Bordetella avium]AZY47921.1 preprotein translocase subunit SecD [Bordetella avium]AZY51292.1 preprotein translocase subunit SecD [Bordetella avium]RIQ14852.1 preprotein translocase subunit SecD [Bordetella avium]RIQ35308.1 preprotein translocase subunit SecD [Bordetella avium]RIQ41317.1 preprotein translocase subunit SecD [Bordetella avium]